MGVESRQDLGGALDWMVGPTSIVRAVRTILNAPGEPRLFSVASVPNSLTSIAGAEMAGHTGAMAETWEQAAASAIGECVERYCCAVQPPNLLTAPARQLGEGALLVDDFELFDERQYAHPQFPFARHTEDLPMTWVPAARIRDGEPRFVPACLVYIPYVPRLVEHSDMVALSVSSGQACHSDADLALLSGLYEVIERDAFMLTWVRRLPPTRLNYRDDPVVGPWFDRYFADSSLTFDVFRLRSDIAVPSVLCVARGIHHQGPFACVGASCRLDESEAVRKAIVEAAQGAATSSTPSPTGNTAPTTQMSGTSRTTCASMATRACLNTLTSFTSTSGTASRPRRTSLGFAPSGSRFWTALRRLACRPWSSTSRPATSQTRGWWCCVS